METIKDLVVLVSLSNGEVHQVSLDKNRTDLVNGLISDLFPNEVLVMPDVLSIKLDNGNQ